MVSIFSSPTPRHSPPSFPLPVTLRQQQAANTMPLPRTASLNSAEDHKTSETTPLPKAASLNSVKASEMTSVPRTANLSSVEDHKTGCRADISPHSPPASSGHRTSVRPNSNTEPKSLGLGPFASTLNRERNDLSEQDLRDLCGHKVSRGLTEKVFRRFRTKAPTTANFRLDSVPTCPALVGSVFLCSETSVLELHGCQNSDEHAATAGGEHEYERPGMCPPFPSANATCSIS